MKLRYLVSSLFTAVTLSFTANAAQAMPASTSDTIEVQVVDYSGKPPFKRKVVSMSVNDVAQLESVGEEAIEYVEVKEVIMRGKPPYRRVTTMMPVYDIAQLEVLEEQNEKQKRGTRPPFKRN
ncbi:hypothetical protein [Alteromonas mediterranea]|mgnify:FL=1|uniref:Uncharacterized protein n=1 Tax=Alteromonas mediterranea (strain DSM 17117 / CIP 110805 / LMG 28347 / Deep ecotype) TaxID=1774373 RepID=F2GBC6_ALTMD|nr:hypothetical protein [Alteromonas mediterranea]AEA98972.1 hypothetical protein MADE_1014190 [Alteromonas mediterranea DE]CAH1209092.1 hypothetical protein ISS312_01280 [Alteromonas mediterranea]